MADAVAAYKQGATVGDKTVAFWEAEGGSISMGVEKVALVHLEAGGSVVVGGGPRKGRKLPSFLEGVAFRACCRRGADQRRWGCDVESKRGWW